MSTAICTPVDFGTFDPNSLSSDSGQSRFDTILELAQTVIDNIDSGLETAYFVDYGVGHLAASIWGMFLLVFLVLGALPICCARCCCRTRCCAPKDQYVLPGYPAGRCDGYGIATIAWYVFYIVTVSLAIYLPFSMAEFGDALNQWSCVLVEVGSTAHGTVDSLRGTANAIFGVVGASIGDVTDFANDTIDLVEVDALNLQAQIDTVAGVVQAGCVAITTSPEYQHLANLSTDPLTYDCDALDVSAGPSDQVDALDAALTDARAAVASIKAGVDDILANATQTLEDVLDEAEDLISEYQDLGTGLTLDSDVAPIPLILPNGLSSGITLAEAVDEGTSALPPLFALYLVFVYFGLLLWLIGMLVLGCVKCNAEKAQGGADHQGRSAEIKNGCCGRCLNMGGCVCAYWGVFLLVFSSIVFLFMAATMWDGFIVYYHAPFNSAAVVELVDETGALPEPNAASESFVDRIDVRAAVKAGLDECVVGSGSVSTVMTSSNLSVESLVTEFFDPNSFNISGEADFSAQLDDARAAVGVARAALQAEAFSASDIAKAENAANHCCEYEALFELFVTDCADAGSMCWACENTISDCTPDPGTCTNPNDGSPSDECQTFAADILFVMTSQNNVIGNGTAGVDAIPPLLDDIEAADYGGQIQARLDSAVDALYPDIETEIDAFSCNDLGQIYYGLYDYMLEPVAYTFTKAAVVLTFIVLFVIVLVFLQIPVDVRLGNAGIDPNNVQQSVIRHVQSTDVAVEMTVVAGPELPVAQPLTPSETPYRVQQADGDGGNGAGGGGGAADAYSPQRTDEYGNTSPKRGYY